MLLVQWPGIVESAQGSAHALLHEANGKGRVPRADAANAVSAASCHFSANWSSMGEGLGVHVMPHRRVWPADKVPEADKDERPGLGCNAKDEGQLEQAAWWPPGLNRLAFPPRQQEHLHPSNCWLGGCSSFPVENHCCRLHGGKHWLTQMAQVHQGHIDLLMTDMQGGSPRAGWQPVHLKKTAARVPPGKSPACCMMRASGKGLALT